MRRFALFAVLASLALMLPADARPRGAHHHHHVTKHATSHVTKHVTKRKVRRVRHIRVAIPVDREAGGWGWGGDLVQVARSQIGNGAIYGRARLWCSRWIGWVLERTGSRGTGSDLARSYATYGSPAHGPQVGAIAVMTRPKGGRGAGHVGIVSGIDAHGNPIVISGNHGGRVAEAVYPRGRVYAYRMP